MALVACIFIGPRKGRFTEGGRVIPIPGHSVPIAFLGGFVLLFGFLAFNAGGNVRYNINLINNEVPKQIFREHIPSIYFIIIYW